MIARFDHHPIRMELALATIVCLLLLLVSLIAAPTVSESVPGVSPAGGPPAHSDVVQTMML
jgi:hypothetical protein